MSRNNVLNTTTVNYLELIGNGKTYRVPPYQRDYAWTEEEWEDLWNDVLDLRERPEARHYMGALVIKGASDRDFTIIDGQQRLATIGVLSLAIIAKLHRTADHDIDAERNRERATELRNRFIGEKDPASLIESSRLNLSRADDAFYQDYLVQLRIPPNPRGLARSNALLWRCFQYFSGQLEDDADGVERQRDAETDPASIEHILPQNPAGGWTDAFTATEIQAAAERIGNATLLEPALNREIASAPYADKRPAYERSAYALTRQVVEMAPEEWTFAFVEKRQQHLAQRAVHVWRSDFP